MSPTYNTSGSYNAFLSEVAAEDKKLDLMPYVEDYQSSRDFSPGLARYFTYKREGLDFNDEKDRLIVAVHFLTINAMIAATPK